MAIKYLIRKEVLPCRCMRYVYEHEVDILHCEFHAQLVNNLTPTAREQLLYNLRTNPAFVPKPKKPPKDFTIIKRIGYVFVLAFFMIVTIACVLMLMPLPAITTYKTPPTNFPTQNETIEWTTPPIQGKQPNPFDYYKRTSPLISEIPDSPSSRLTGDSSRYNMSPQ